MTATADPFNPLPHRFFLDHLCQEFIDEKVYVASSFLKDFLEKKIESEVATARKNAKTNKRAALQALKRKKRWTPVLPYFE